MTSPQATDIKERPILFSTEMVRALLEGRKSMTRRIIKPQPESKNGMIHYVGAIWSPASFAHYCCPYGKVGERLWVRETHLAHIDDREVVIYQEQNKDERFAKLWKTVPSIHMKRKHSRILLEITDVKVERLQDISDMDSIREGVKKVDKYSFKDYVDPDINRYSTPRLSFMSLWESINGKDSWSANPWVWVVSFKVIQPTPSNAVEVPLPEITSRSVPTLPAPSNANISRFAELLEKRKSMEANFSEEEELIVLSKNLSKEELDKIDPELLTYSSGKRLENIMNLLDELYAVIERGEKPAPSNAVEVPLPDIADADMICGCGALLTLDEWEMFGTCDNCRCA